MFGKIASDDERTILISRDKILLCKCSSKKELFIMSRIRIHTFIKEAAWKILFVH